MDSPLRHRVLLSLRVERALGLRSVPRPQRAFTGAAESAAVTEVEASAEPVASAAKTIAKARAAPPPDVVQCTDAPATGAMATAPPFTGEALDRDGHGGKLRDYGAHEG